MFLRFTPNHRRNDQQPVEKMVSSCKLLLAVLRSRQVGSYRTATGTWSVDVVVDG